MTASRPDGPGGDQRPVQSAVDLTGLHRKAVEALARDLFPREIIRVVILGERDQAIIGTHRRALVFKKGSAGGALFTTELISWDYAHLTGVRTQTSDRAGAVILEASHPSGRHRRLRGSYDKDPFKAPNAIPITPPFEPALVAAESLRALIASGHEPVPVAAPAPAPAPSPAQELHHLAELREMGIITVEEFEIMKARIVHGS